MKYLSTVFISLFLLFVIPSAFAQTITVPSPHCLGTSCSTISPSPSIDPSDASPSSSVNNLPSSFPSSNPSRNPSPSSSPCSTTQNAVTSKSSGTVQAMDYDHAYGGGKKHYSGNNGFLQQFMQFLLQLLQLIFKQLGITLPITSPTNPCPSPAPSAVPSPSSISPNQTLTPSQSPSENPNPTIGAPSSVSPTPNSSSPIPVGVSGNWKLIFDDEFNNTSLNKTTWAPGWFGSGITTPISSAGTDCYDPAEVQFPGDGYMHLHYEAKQETCGGATKQYASGFVSSNPQDGVSGHTGFQYAYGYMEVRAYLPPSGSQIANWPSIWTDGQNWPTDGEDDIMEGLDGQPCYHFHSPSGGPGDCATGNFSGWHTFASDWEPGSVTYYYDGKKVGQITTGITSAPQYIIMSNDQGTDNGAITVPTDMEVDYVRVWQAQ